MINTQYQQRLLMSLIILLSSFFLLYAYSLTHLQDKITQASISPNQLKILDVIEPFITPEQRLSNLLVINNRQAWLNLAKIYAQHKAEIAYQLAQYYINQGQEKSAVVWYQQAIRQHHKTAAIALAQYYFSIGQYQDIKALLLPLINNIDALVILYKLAIQLGDIAFISQYQHQLKNSAYVDFYNELLEFSVFNLAQQEHQQLNKKLMSQLNSKPNSKTAEKKNNKLAQCYVKVELFATNLDGFRHGKKLITQFKQHKLSNFICLNTPKYIPAQHVNCQHSQQERISCTASVWATRNDINSRYIGLIVEQGGANVDNGIMYIDQHDEVNVLAHELSHLIGFIDEYPLPKQHLKCSINQNKPFSHNVVTLEKYHYGEKSTVRKRILAQLPWGKLIKDSTPILLKNNAKVISTNKKHWMLQTPKTFQQEIGLYKTHSCDKNPYVQAFKPYYKRTQLEYYELDFPQEYIDIMSLAPKKFLMPSYIFNVNRELFR